MHVPPLRHNAFTALLIGLGGLGGVVMAALGTPLPFMLGSLMATALVVAFAQHRFPEGYAFPMPFRMVFVGVIGTMIGARLTPDTLGLLPLLAVSVPAVLVFVPVAHALNYAVFRRLGGYDRATAFYSASPGGLFEAILFGEEAGADVRILTMMQFLRIIAVVTLVPVGMSIWEGHPVGSAAGLSFGTGQSDWHHIPLVLAIAVAGLWLGKRLHVPAAQLIGPLIVAGALTMTGLVEIAAPGWMVAVAQVVLGAGLGIRFTGMSRTMFLRGTGLSVVSVAVMMALGIALSVILHAVSGLPLDMLVVSFAPGGVVEMSLIALSIAANPAIVTLHHLVRILFTVVEMSVARARGWI